MNINRIPPQGSPLHHHPFLSFHPRDSQDIENINSKGINRFINPGRKVWPGIYGESLNVSSSLVESKQIEKRMMTERGYEEKAPQMNINYNSIVNLNFPATHRGGSPQSLQTPLLPPPPKAYKTIPATLSHVIPNFPTLNLPITKPELKSNQLPKQAHSTGMMPTQSTSNAKGCPGKLLNNNLGENIPLRIAEEYHKLGYEARKEENYLSAISLYSRALISDPTYFKAWFNRAFANDKIGNLNEAISDYSKAINIDPENAFPHYNRGICLDRKGEYDLAIEDFNKAIGIDPERSDFYHNRGFAYRKKEMFSEAIVDYTRALSRNPKHFKAYYNRAFCYETLNKLEKAEGDYKLALELNESSISALHHLATVREKMGGDKLLLSILNFDRYISIFYIYI